VHRLFTVLLFAACSTSGSGPPSVAQTVAQNRPGPPAGGGLRRLYQADGGLVGYLDESLVYPTGLRCGLHLLPLADGGAEWAGATYHGIQFASADCSGQGYLLASLELSYLFASCFAGDGTRAFYAARQPVQTVKVDVFSTLEGSRCNRGYLPGLALYPVDVVSAPPLPAPPLSAGAP
jgi:hypothetical protein